ncbi:hypothetical protein EDD22DRAFT_870568 [Suillus occidentalis]|nr:hypothetical protein EDD22DRAFT_870568 [Suillus occidentalis]
MMMPVEALQGSLHLRHVLQASIQAFDSDEESSALDIIDRECVMKYKTSWGRHHYEVMGTTSTYTVFPHLGAASTAVSSYCTCPSFAYAVLISENHFMCKHVLAVCLADRWSRCVVRPIEDDDLLLKFAGHVSP